MISQLLIVSLSFIKIIYSETCNYSFSCDLDEKSDYCAIKERTDSESIFEIKLQQNPKMSCNIYEILLGDSEKQTSYQTSSNNTYKYPSYPGGVCQSSFNCLSGLCTNGKTCFDSQIDDTCYYHENCPLNTACINGTCRPYFKKGENCTDSYQCEYDSFCNKQSKKCEELFHYENNQDITDYATLGEKIENLCVNGGYITEKDEENNTHIICETLTNTDFNCNDECTYITSDKNQYISKSKCLCGFNKYRSKHCVLGNGDPAYQEYLKMKKEFIKNKELTKYCHTLERDNDEICLELINTNLSVSFRNYVKEYNNKKILALQHHRLQESESCIKEVVFNYDTNPIFSIEQHCPKFSCDSKKLNCLYGYNPLLENGNNISVILNPLSCSEKEYCTLPEENKLINTSIIMSKEKVEGQCKIYQGKKGIKRYPGESCNINSDCLIENSICKNGKCTGVGDGGFCNETEQCLAGLYCNKEEQKCIHQKNEGEKCKEGWDCENYLGCFKGRCIKFGTLKKGIKITKESAYFPGNDIRNYLCITGELNEENGEPGNYCSLYDYDSKWLNRTKKKPDKNGYIECNFGEECIYNNGRNNMTKYCECGYNSKGIGYCPLPSSRNLGAWKDRIKFIGDSANNHCHTLSRFNCYENNNYDFYVKERIYESKTTEAHLFYNSIDCAFKMFVKQNNIKINYILVIFLIAILF